jgi:hypothetical protein
MKQASLHILDSQVDYNDHDLILLVDASSTSSYGPCGAGANILHDWALETHMCRMLFNCIPVCRICSVYMQKCYRRALPRNPNNALSKRAIGHMVQARVRTRHVSSYPLHKCSKTLYLIIYGFLVGFQNVKSCKSIATHLTCQIAAIISANGTVPAS